MNSLQSNRVLLGAAVILFAAVPVILLGGYFSRPVSTEPDVVPGDIRKVTLGRVPAGAVLTHVFMVRNPSSKPLHVREVKSTCSCTVTTELPPILSPGKSYPLTMKADSGTRTGPWTFRAVVLIEDQPPTEVAVQAYLVNRLPSEFSFGRQMRGAAATKRLKVVPARNDEQLKIRTIDADDRYFAVRQGTEGSSLWIEISLRPDVRSDGGFDKQITVQFDGEPEVKNIIRVTGWIERDIENKPSELNFGMVQDGGLAHQRLTLYSPYGKSIRFLRLEGDSDQKLKVDSVREAGQSCEVDFALDPKRVKSLEVFNVRVVGESGGKEYTIPIDCYVGKQGDSNG